MIDIMVGLLLRYGASVTWCPAIALQIASQRISPPLHVRDLPLDPAKCNRAHRSFTISG